MTVFLNHTFGSAEATIPVVGESTAYLLLNVFLPMFIELAAVIVLIIWIVLVIRKPRFSESAAIYVGTIRYNQANGTHMIRDFRKVQLNKYNSIKKGNGRLKFKKEADTIVVNGIKIQASYSGRILCHMPFPWYRGKVTPSNSDFSNLTTPFSVMQHFERKSSLEVNEFVATETIRDDSQRSLSSADAIPCKYIVIPDSGRTTIISDKKVILSGKIFVYKNG